MQNTRSAAVYGAHDEWQDWSYETEGSSPPPLLGRPRHQPTGLTRGSDSPHSSRRVQPLHVGSDQIRVEWDRRQRGSSKVGLPLGQAVGRAEDVRDLLEREGEEEDHTTAVSISIQRCHSKAFIFVLTLSNLLSMAQTVSSSSPGTTVPIGCLPSTSLLSAFFFSVSTA